MEGNNLSEDDNLENFLKPFGVGRRAPRDQFLDDTHKACKVFERKGVVVQDEEELCHQLMKEFTCNACFATFQNLHDYELHYHNNHHLVCSQCKKWKPNDRLLEIHVEETHDSFFKTRAEKEPMYQCFVVDCSQKFNDHRERRLHCVTVHNFPNIFLYDSTIKEEKLKQDSNSQSKDDEAMDVDESNLSKEINTKVYLGKNRCPMFTKKKFTLNPPIVNKSTTLSEGQNLPPVTMFIPRSVQQKSYAQHLTNNQQANRDILETDSIMELGESLPQT